MRTSDIKSQLIRRGYIPLDKSWMIRMGILDLFNGRNDIFEFLESQGDELCDDLQALLHALKSWKAGERDIDVGESATLYRFLRFASWKLGENKRFILHKTLRQRKICDYSGITRYSLKDLLRLDSGTSQWASAAVLLGNREVVVNPSLKLKLTYEAVAHWEEQRKNNKCWESRHDETILSQVIAFLGLLKKEDVAFVPQQPEDYSFARIFGFITKAKGESLWPSLRGHESDRIEEVERVIEDINNRREIESKDHRVIQAGAMYQKLNNEAIRIKHPLSVNKSWPQFWRFMNDIPKLIRI